MGWVPAANAEETLPSETASESPEPLDMPSLELPTDSPTETPAESPTDSPAESPTESPTDGPSESPTEPASESPTEPSTESPTETPSGSPTGPTTPPYTEPPTQPPATIQLITPGQAVALAASVMSPISMLSSVLSAVPLTPGSVSDPTSSLPTPPAADDPSPSESPATDDLALSGSDTREPMDDVPWGGVVVILLCGAFGVFGYSVASRGGSGTAGHS